MRRIHLLQSWFSLSDPAMEEALAESGLVHHVRRTAANAADFT
ncbi:hypothetical protein C4K04_4452 [Pseudomonas chlororaphis]|uniref:Uncharacterized protein n=1 Tax=Pseudomonas chlororaphis TaxID=587753 RepID=A0A3G7TT90_9PSED|nr:hypothetical protein C4K04_4452 [Pseudomonas chlororaphis]